MACPRCGGEDRTPLAPGLWRCTSLQEVRSGGPGLTDPSLGPPIIVTSVPCGCEYQEAVPGVVEDSCSCGTFAIGRCAECAVPVCGEHSALRGGRRLCRPHIRAEEDAAAAAAASARARRWDEQRARRERWRSDMEAVLGRCSGPERIVRVVGGLTQDSTGGPGLTDWSAVHLLLRYQVNPEKPGWNLEELVDWFRSRVRGAPPHEVRLERRTVFGGYKSYLTPAWTLYAGSTVSFKYRDSSSGGFEALAVLPGGPLMIGAGPSGWARVVDGRSESNGAVVNVSAHGLRQMGKLVGVSFISRPPAG